MSIEPVNLRAPQPLAYWSHVALTAAVLLMVVGICTTLFVVAAQ